MLRLGPAAAPIAMLLLGQLDPGAALAQAPADDAAALEAAQVPPTFVVELLVFRYNELNGFEEAFGPSTPRWPKSLNDVTRRAAPGELAPGSPAWYLDDVLSPRPQPPAFGTPAPPGVTLPAPPPPVGRPDAPSQAQLATRSPPWYRLLERDELELGQAFARLNNLGAYTPLLHTGWSQPVLLENEAQPFELAWLGRLQPAGSIRLHRSRFLHLTLDVSLQADHRYHQSVPNPGSRWPLAEFVGPVRYRIDAQRRVRSGELHFFDHPAFGILIVVRPAPVDPASDAGPAMGPAA